MVSASTQKTVIDQLFYHLASWRNSRRHLAHRMVHLCQLLLLFRKARNDLRLLRFSLRWRLDDRPHWGRQLVLVHLRCLLLSIEAKFSLSGIVQGLYHWLPFKTIFKHTPNLYYTSLNNHLSRSSIFCPNFTFFLKIINMVTYWKIRP